MGGRINSGILEVCSLLHGIYYNTNLNFFVSEYSFAEISIVSPKQVHELVERHVGKVFWGAGIYVEFHTLGDIDKGVIFHRRLVDERCRNDYLMAVGR